MTYRAIASTPQLSVEQLVAFHWLPPRHAQLWLCEDVASIALQSQPILHRSEDESLHHQKGEGEGVCRRNRKRSIYSEQ